MNEQNCVTYEYKTVTVKRDLAPLYIDNYKNFGWETEDARYSLTEIGDVTIHFKRNRKIPNKNELNQLQNQFDEGVQEILKLEKSKTKAPAITAMSVGTVGTVLMAVAVFAALADKIAIGTVVAVPGMVLWTLPYFLYNKQVKSKTAKVTPQIDRKYDQLYEICEQAHSLLVK